LRAACSFSKLNITSAEAFVTFSYTPPRFPLDTHEVLLTEKPAMMRHLIPCGLTALLLTALARPTPAAEPVPASDSEKLDRIYKELLLERGQLNVRMKEMEQDVRELRRRIEQLEAQLHAQDAERARIARSFTPSTMSGAIVLQNRSAYLATIYVEGVPYLLNPGQVQTLPPRPTGRITYEVAAEGWGVIQPPTIRTLFADRPFYIYVNP